MTKQKKTSKRLTRQQNTTQKTKYLVTRTSLKRATPFAQEKELPYSTSGYCQDFDGKFSSVDFSIDEKSMGKLLHQ